MFRECFASASRASREAFASLSRRIFHDLGFGDIFEISGRMKRMLGFGRDHINCFNVLGCLFCTPNTVGTQHAGLAVVRAFRAYGPGDDFPELNFVLVLQFLLFYKFCKRANKNAPR